MIRSKLICVILIDLVAESAAVGERGKDFVLVRWAEGVWSALGPVRRDVLRPGIRGPMEIRAVLVAARAIGPVARSPRASREDPARPRARVGRRAAESLGSLRRPEGENIPEHAVGQAEAGLEHGVRRLFGAPADHERPEPQDFLPLCL